MGVGLGFLRKNPDTGFLPYFLAFQQMGRGKFGLMKAESGGEVVYDPLESMVHNKSFWVDAEVARASTPK